MQISVQKEIGVTAKAILREGKLSLSVTFSAPYGERKAADVISNFPDTVREKIAKALQAVIDSCLEQGIELAEEAAQISRRIARDRGEQI